MGLCTVLGSEKLGAENDVVITVAAAKSATFLALKVSFDDRARRLLYVFWEPSNAIDYKQFMTHREEIADLPDRVRECSTRLLSINYPALWREWQSTSTWPGITTHIARLQKRCSFSL